MLLWWGDGWARAMEKDLLCVEGVRRGCVSTTFAPLCSALLTKCPQISGPLGEAVWQQDICWAGAELWWPPGQLREKGKDEAVRSQGYRIAAVNTLLMPTCALKQSLPVQYTPWFPETSSGTPDLPNSPASSGTLRIQIYAGVQGPGPVIWLYLLLKFCCWMQKDCPSCTNVHSPRHLSLSVPQSISLWTNVYAKGPSKAL